MRSHCLSSGINQGGWREGLLREDGEDRRSRGPGEFTRLRRRPFRSVRRTILGIPPEEATFERRGFTGGNPASRIRLEQVGTSFLRGYNAAIDEDELEPLVRRLNEVDEGFRGFAFEGAAMGLAIRDGLTLWRSKRLETLLAGPGSAHVYMVHVGAGWALGRIKWPMRRVMASLDPLLRWLVFDGYGFHEGYFHWRKYVFNLARPGGLSGYALRVFDQGLGRSLWFVHGADTETLPATIEAFPRTRHSDLWSGVGLACTYAGGVNETELQALRCAAGRYAPHMAQGAAFAAKARQRAGNPAPQTELACQILCRRSAARAAEVTDLALIDLAGDDNYPDYETWRLRIQEQFS